MPTFLPGAELLALAGLAAAAAPLVIHLFNQRRFRVLDWAAMDFLLEAAGRSRRLLEFRDLLLLVLRTAAVALFGLAVARPFLSTGTGGGVSDGPVHAVLVIDNSMSMARERLGGTTLLDDARERAKEFVGRLPAGSRVSVIPLCGPEGSFSFDPRRSTEDAIEAIDAVRVVDRGGNAAAMVDLASRAVAVGGDVPDKRVVFIGDQQAVVWPNGAEGLLEGLGDLAAAGIQVAALPPAEPDNSWVESLELEDGIADPETVATFTAVIRHEGREPRPGVLASLTIDGVEVAAETVDLVPGQARELVFTQRLDANPAAGRPAFVSARLSLTPDRLPIDDSRAIVFPVVAALPVVFVDQHGGSGEEPRLGRYGETRHLRRLLAPVLDREENVRHLIQVRHVRIDELDRDLLADVRLAVVAGVRGPGSAVPLLREFVAQGGRLVVAAGGEFDPEEWDRDGWLEGEGILPLPLTGDIGGLPDDPTAGPPFFLSWASMRDRGLFRLPGVGEQELADLYTAPVFFKAVTGQTDAAELARIAAADRRRLEELQAARRRLAEEIDRLEAQEARGLLEPADRGMLQEARAALAPLEPDWLEWADHDSLASPEEQRGPQVIAGFDNGQPFLVSRRVGHGRVVWVASGLFSPWNTLPRTNAMLIFDRLLRGLLAETLPIRTLDTADAVTLPLAAEDRRAAFRVARPDGTGESLQAEALGPRAFGLTIRDPVQRGVYEVTARRPDLADRQRAMRPLWSLPLAVNGPARESQPERLDPAGFAAKVGGDSGFRWVDPDEPLSLDGTRVRGQHAWWWLFLLALGCLVGENTLLARTHSRLSADATGGRP